MEVRRKTVLCLDMEKPFPDSPKQGDRFTVGEETYVYDGVFGWITADELAELRQSEPRLAP